MNGKYICMCGGASDRQPSGLWNRFSVFASSDMPLQFKYINVMVWYVYVLTRAKNMCDIRILSKFAIKLEVFSTKFSLPKAHV